MIIDTDKVPFVGYWDEGGGIQFWFNGERQSNIVNCNLRMSDIDNHWCEAIIEKQDVSIDKSGKYDIGSHFEKWLLDIDNYKIYEHND